ncbi:MAG: hypothetical protein ACR2IE_12570 [Candidatus Sumerlaeaceae bacterium]
MGIEDIEVRITKSGEIYVKLEGASEQRVNNYRMFLEQQVGSLLGTEILQRPDWERPAGWVSQDEEKQKREQELRRG